MATVFQENIAPQHEKITVQLTKEDYLPAVDKALKVYGKKASIPGFRAGMVPAGVIRKMYGQSVFSDEVLRVAGTKLEEHLVANKAEIFARPIPAEGQAQMNFDVNNPTDFTFEFEIGTRPDFTIPLLSGSETVPLHKIIVSDEMLRDEIEKLQYKAGEMTEPETVTSEHNVLNVVFDEVDTDGNLIEGGIKKDNSLLVKYFTPALQSQLMGKKAEDTLVFNLKNTFDEKLLPAILKDLGLNPTDEAAKDKSFKMTITKVGLIEKVELGKEMYEKIYPGRGLETEEEFATILKEEIERYWESQSRIRLHNELFEKLVHETPIEMPVKFLKRWMSVGGETYKSPDQVDKEYGSFEHQLRWQLISDKVIAENKITVEKEELEDAARMQIMSYFGQQGHMPQMNDDWFEPFIQKQMADQKFVDELYNKIITEKLFYVLEQKVNLMEQLVSLDEFIKLPSSHHHHH
ncbi:MAG TPA: trigger factor [Chitinophagaceae bacterium]|jgi:trigger factor|nr:trigger factor [Chitinophagaceae bacterium]